MKIFEGQVISVSMNKTIVVYIERKVPHPLYRKMIKRSKNFLVDSAEFDVKVGNRVRIVETRPVSRNKYFKVSKILDSAVKNVSKKQEEKIVKAPKEVLDQTKPKTVRKTTAVKPRSPKVKEAKKEKK